MAVDAFSDHDQHPNKASPLPTIHEHTALLPAGSFKLKQVSTPSGDATTTSTQQHTINLHFKQDHQQLSGSFKLRGISKVVSEAKIRGCQACVCSSGGNAGLACAVACKFYQLTCTIVLPTTTPEFCKDLLKKMNSEVQILIHGRVWNEANERALAMVEEGREKGGIFSGTLFG